MVEEIVKNTRVTDYVEIDAPIEVVWKDLTHFVEYDWDPEIQKIKILTPEVKGVGMKTQWEFVDIRGDQVQQVEEIVEWNPPYYYSYRPQGIQHPLVVTFVLKPVEKGTFVILTKRFDDDMPHIKKVEDITKEQMRKLKASSEAKAQSPK
ncbi:MAG: SRPBCC family protein [Candidatus Ranarchaeia archaeon]|jgi:hypothetical protein